MGNIYAAIIADGYALDYTVVRSARIGGHMVGNIQQNKDMQAAIGRYPIGYGWPDKPEGDYRAKYDLVDGVIQRTWEAYVPEPEVWNLSKFQIRVKLRELGIEPAFEALLDTPDGDGNTARALWNDSDSLLTNHPMFLAMKPALMNMTGTDETSFTELLSACRIP